MTPLRELGWVSITDAEAERFQKTLPGPPRKHVSPAVGQGSPWLSLSGAHGSCRGRHLGLLPFLSTSGTTSAPCRAPGAKSPTSVPPTQMSVLCERQVQGHPPSCSDSGGPCHPRHGLPSPLCPLLLCKQPSVLGQPLPPSLPRLLPPPLLPPLPAQPGHSSLPSTVSRSPRVRLSRDVGGELQHAGNA